MNDEQKRQRQREATRRWRERNPDKVQQANRKPRQRAYDPIKTKEWREARLAQPGYREEENRKANQRNKALKRFLNDYKLEHGCVDCGYRKHPAALEFDHVDGTKARNVAFAKSKQQALAEIAKCVVRCANCHRIRHYEEHQSSLTSS